MKALSTLAQSVRASTTMAIDTQFKKMRAEGIDVIGFSVGEPDFPTPEHIKQAGIRAIENDQTKYTPTPGTLALDYDEEQGLLYIHALDARRREDVTETLIELERRLLAWLDAGKAEGVTP